MNGLRVFSCVLGLAELAGCGGRDELWTKHSFPAAYGLSGAAALLDADADRVLLLAANADAELVTSSIKVGKGATAAAATAGGERLLVLSRGIVPRRRADDDGPSLTVIDGAGAEAPRRYELSDPLSGLAVDPASRYAVVYPAASDTAFVENPNELIVVDLSLPPGPDNPVPITLRSFGGQPQGFTFTPALELPGGSRRLLVVRTNRDVALLDLDHLSIPEITVNLTGGAQPLVPASIAVTDGAPGVADDARLAVRVDGDPNLVVIDLLPVPKEDQPKTPQSFRAAPNVVFAGGVPTDVTFLQTDGGLRLAALVPSKSSVTLIDPGTGSSSSVSLGAPFERLSLVTDVVGTTDKGSDVALLWSSSSHDIAFLALGATVGKPYKSVDHLSLDGPVSAVIDVPGAGKQLKLLVGNGGATYTILDLLKRTASPILASGYATSITPSLDGGRAWIFTPGGGDLAMLDLATLHPTNLALGQPIAAAFDIKRSDGGRALLAIHDVGAVGATVLDGRRPALLTARSYGGLLLGGFE